MTSDPSGADLILMRRALAEAEHGRGLVEPNPMVGAVVARDGRIVAVGHHARFGGPHAEVVALQHAGEAARGATLYVTLEPCCHHGKTPPCTDAIERAGVARVVAAMRDPFPRVAGGGIAQLERLGIAVAVGVDEPAARRLNAPYLKRLATGRPFVTAKWAMTLDGKTSCHTGDSKWISGPRSRALVHELRGRMDAIVVGIQTALIDDPELTVRPPGPRAPLRIVLDSAARLPLNSRLVQTARAQPVLTAVADRAPADRTAALIAAGCEVVRFPGAGPVPIRPLLELLGARGMTNLLVEGGGATTGAFFDADEVDAVWMFLAPIIEGGGQSASPVRGAGRDQMADAARLGRHEVLVLDGDVLVRGEFDRPWLSA